MSKHRKSTATTRKSRGNRNSKTSMRLMDKIALTGLVIMLLFFLIPAQANAEEYRASKIIHDSAVAAVNEVSSSINDAALKADRAAGEFLVTVPYIAEAISQRLDDAEFVNRYNHACTPGRFKWVDPIKDAMQTEYTKLWCAETYGDYVNNWRPK